MTTRRGRALLGARLAPLGSISPGATERLVQLYAGHELLPLGLSECQLTREQISLRIEHLEVARDTRLVSAIGQVEGPAQRIHLTLLSDCLIARRTNADERVLGLTPRDKGRLLIREA